MLANIRGVTGKVCSGVCRARESLSGTASESAAAEKYLRSVPREVKQCQLTLGIGQLESRRQPDLLTATHLSDTGFRHRGDIVRNDGAYTWQKHFEW